MLLVFLMAASIAIMLYMQLPRAAFEAQRAQEEMLQERGEQYIRAIQLYVAKWRSYPPKSGRAGENEQRALPAQTLQGSDDRQR